LGVDRVSETITATDLPPSQRERRQRILEAARVLASKGGYDGVQMRDVADRAEVALGTLYRYFPSKVHLLVALMQDETARLAERLDRRPVEGATAADRVTAALTRGIKGLQREPALAEAMTRALMFADASAAADVHSVTELTTRAITTAMQGPDRAPSEDDDAIARVIEQVWLSSMLAWLSGRSSTAQLTEDIQIAARLLLR
jgi:TetR/AcrR family transcriptional regulator, cholesterol catabolism regulator